MSSSSAGAQQESHQRVGYDTSTRKWTGQGLAIVSDRSGQVLLSVPIEFLSKGMVNSFAYVLQSIHMAFDVRAGHICSEAGDECSPLDAVTPGRFIYWNAGMYGPHNACSATFAYHPECTAHKSHFFTSSFDRDRLLQATHRTSFQVHVETSTRWR
jgi:hypothetical protein